MNLRRLLVGGLALVLVAAGCGSQAPSTQRVPTATVRLYRAPTRTPSWEELDPNSRSATMTAREWEDQEDRATEAAEALAERATDAAESMKYARSVGATMTQEWKVDVRDCILAGNNDTLCELDPQNPYGPQRSGRAGAGCVPTIWQTASTSSSVRMRVLVALHSRI